MSPEIMTSGLGEACWDGMKAKLSCHIITGVSRVNGITRASNHDVGGGGGRFVLSLYIADEIGRVIRRARILVIKIEILQLESN